MKYRGFLMQTGVKNKNGRIYPSEVFDKAVKEYSKKIIQQTSLGELGHPDSLDVTSSRVSHLITGIKTTYPRIPRKKKKAMKIAGTYQKDTYIVNYRLLDTEKGREAKRLIKTLVPSPRGTGSINSQGVVLEDYKIFAIDLIHKNDRA